MKPASSHKNRKSGIQSQSISISGQYSGFIPPPDWIDRYEKICPGYADRLLKMAEAESLHRRAIEDKAVESSIEETRAARREARRGQYLGFAIGISALLCGTICAYIGAPIAAGLIGGGGIVGLVAVFVLGRKDQQVA